MMRYRFAGLLLFFTLALFGQEQNEPYFIQQAPVQKALDCYQFNLEEGLFARKRGDLRQALRLFREAQNCPEAQKIPARQDEIRALIAQCEEQRAVVVTQGKPTAAPSKKTAVIPLPTAATGGSERRRFQPSRQFLLFDKPECFDITSAEAARAFAGGYWDDAAALYRASKNCSDADQNDRRIANQKIENCRVASQNELRQKEQEAIRQARHAIAANRANDATQLLRTLDRSLAYRLADFSNEYIAPDDNDACRQAIFDALYYTPSVHSGMTNDQFLVPFCYQLGDNLDRDLQVRFLGRETPTRICAFARSRHLLFQWDAESFEPRAPVSMEDTTLIHFDAVPDGRTLLFLSNNAYLFWRSQREVYRLQVPKLSRYCFNDDGSLFYYVDASDMQVYCLNLHEVFAQQKGYRQRNAITATGITAGDYYLSIASRKNQLWLGYRDSIAVYKKGRSQDSQWKPERRVLLTFEVPGYSDNTLPYQWLDPASQTAVFTNDSAVYIFQLQESDSILNEPTVALPGAGLAVGANAQYIALYLDYTSETQSHILLYRPADGQYKFGARVPGGEEQTFLNNGRFSPDNRLFATTTRGGKLEVWTLGEGLSQRTARLEESNSIAINADGSGLLVLQHDSLLLLSAENPGGRPLQSTTIQFDGLPFLIAGQRWFAYRADEESVVLTDQLGQRRWVAASPVGDLGETILAISPDETQFAYVSADGTVVVRSLDDGQETGARAFGGPVDQLHFLPQTGEVLVVHRANVEGMDPTDETVVKIWDPAAPSDAKMRTVRLLGYATREVAFGAAQGMIAFTNGLDIRLFRQDDLLDEAARIRQYGSGMITALAFHPEKDILAAGYSDGSVVFWDLNTGQARFAWSKPVLDGLSDEQPVVRLRFIDGGLRLHILLEQGILLTRDADLSLVRTGVQSNFRKLISFQPSQIREYNLEQALDYPNNFARLAASGDLPLIRSFFDFYREAAVTSNNIQRVANYCDRASILFGQLESGAQNVLRPILLEMYEDYHWKLLLRNRLDTAQSVVQGMNRDFPATAAVQRANAYTALLREDQRGAARLFANWALQTADLDSRYGLITTKSIDSLHSKIRLLLEYDLIREEQMNCLCGLFGDFAAFEADCSNLPESTQAPLLDPETQLRWNIFKILNTLSKFKNHARQAELLKAALSEAQALQRRSPALARQESEKITLWLAYTLINWGISEQGNALAIRLYQQAIQQLGARGAFQHPTRETERLATLATTYLQMGNAQLQAEKFPDAIQTFRQGVQEAERLLATVAHDQNQYHKYQNDLIVPLQEGIGKAHLLGGNAEEARHAFEQAQNASIEGIEALYFGHAALLAGDDVDALLQYGEIYDEQTLGQALFDIERMASRLPEQTNRLTAFLFNMRRARLQTRAQLDSNVVDYYWAVQKILLYGAREQWDSALLWSTRATEWGEQTLRRPNAPETWPSKWLDALLYQSYFLLFNSTGDTARLSRAIRLSERAGNYLDSTGYYYANQPLLSTNLAHAHWLRGRAGDRALALNLYRTFLGTTYDNFDPWEILLKDFRDLTGAGVKWPDLSALVGQIRPKDAPLSTGDWKAMGINPPED